MQSKLKALLSLSPIAVFLGVYLITAIATGDFYSVPVSSAFLLACIYAICISGKDIGKSIECFSKGAGQSNVLLMIWIFILAGVFASTAKETGAIEATVNATLSILPGKLLYAGLFLTSCFISMAIGTSVGTIVALVPIGAGIAESTGTPLAFMTAIIVGGAFFGDNLSFISDTTIAATRAAGCEMRDKFKTNIFIIFPAVIIVTAIYVVSGMEVEMQTSHNAVEWFKLLPYILILGLALCGMKVTSVLSIGIVFNALLGFFTKSYGWTGWLRCSGEGIAGMSDLIIVTLMAGGLLALIQRGGGLDLIIESMTKHIKGKRGAEASIATLVCLANICTANNTIAIITTGGIAKNVADQYGIDPRKTASILDTFSCLIQGLIPYGAQLLMASGLAGIEPGSIIRYLYYPFVMGIFAVMAIIFQYPKLMKNNF